jgi:hypothetical protein
MRVIAAEPSLAIFSIATNKYLDYWKQLVTSLNSTGTNFSNTEIVLLTDQYSPAKEWAESNFPNLKFHFIEIPNLVWPFATLKRYELLGDVVPEIEAEFMVYIDADMIIKRDILTKIRELKSNGKMYFVPHPGYTVDQSFRTVLNLLMSPSKLAKLLIHRTIGPWESNRISSAFVPLSKRKQYLHGAIWFGEKVTFLDLINFCSAAVAQDAAIDYIAKWHDESHLNAYFAKRGGNIVTSEYSWHPSFKKFICANPIVISAENFGKTR